MNDYHQLRRLAEVQGTPFYVFYPSRFIANLTRFQHCLSAHYQPSIVAYAFKANYMPWLGRCLSEHGFWGEVVSGMEYDIARINLPGDRLIFNGPAKTKYDVERALSAGTLVNVESFNDLRIIESLSSHMGCIEIGVRVAFAISANGTRFGFGYESGELSTALRALRKMPNVKVIGIHSHFTTKERNLSVFRSRARKMLEVYESMACHYDVRYINIGGGFFGPLSDEARQLMGVQPPSFEEYGDTIGSEFAEQLGITGPTLVVEPGVSMVADTMEFVVRTCDVKQSSDTYVVTVDGSINNLFASGSRYEPSYRVVSPVARDVLTADVVGYTCMEHDILLQNAGMPIGVGDFIVFENRGAYSNVYKPPFILPAPPILGIDGEIFARRQTYQDILAPYVK